MIPRLRPAVGLGGLVAAFAARSSVKDFESAFADLAGQAHAIAFPYGRTGLMLLFEALGLRNREIILPAYTCVVVAHAITLSGNRPVFIDSAPAGFNMDLEKAEEAIGPQTGALIATSIHGYPVDLDQLDAMRQRHPELIVIQDCAHSFLAAWRGRPVQKAGRAAVFGLNISKLITSVFGGMITTDDTDLARRLSSIRDRNQSSSGKMRELQRAVYLLVASTALHPLPFALVHRIAQAGLLDRFVKYYDEGKIDMPSDHLVALDNAAASVGVQQCAKYDTIIAQRREIAELYDRLLADVPGMLRPPLVDGATYSHYVPRVADPGELVRCAAHKGVEIGRVIDYCVPDFAAYRAMVPPQADFSRTRCLNREIVNLPLRVSHAQATWVADVVARCLGEIRSNANAACSGRTL